RVRQETSGQVAEATAARARLLTRQLGEYASTLAADLVDGDPCAVCGSVEHPAKAEAPTAHVTEQDLAQVEERVESALEVHEEAASRVARLTERLSHARDEAADQGVESWTEAVAEAQDAIAIHRRAVLDLDALTTRRAHVGREIAQVEREIGQAKDARHQAET